MNPQVNQNQIKTPPVQYMPPQAYATVTQPTATKSGSVGAVNITINGVNSPQQSRPAVPYYQYIPYYQPVYYPVSKPPQNNKITKEKEPTKTLASTKIIKEEHSSSSKNITEEQITTKTLAATQLDKKVPEKQVEEKAKPIPKKELSDNYIKYLENDLKHGDRSVRSKAVTELLKRFKEEPTRKDNKSLTSLLNTALQDSKPTIVLTAMQILDQNYANGDDLTLQLLQHIQNKNDKFGNSATAQGLLTEIAGRNVETASATTSLRNAEVGTKLNIISE